MKKLSEEALEYIKTFKEDITICNNYILEEVLEVKIEVDTFNSLVNQYYSAFIAYLLNTDIYNKSYEEIKEDNIKYFNELKLIHNNYKYGYFKEVVTKESSLYTTIKEIYKLNSLICATRYLIDIRMLNSLNIG